MKNVIYLTRTGLLEPLGQSQVLNYLFGLSKKFSITVISNERSDDLKDIDRVLLLTVNPGFHSQPLVQQVVDKIKKLSLILEQTQTDSVEIVVDGHVNLNTIPKMFQNGAREFVLGKSGLFGKDSKRNLEEIITLLQELESKQDKLSPITSIGYLS